MPQDSNMRQRFEQASHREKQERADAATDLKLNDDILRADQHTGQQGALPPNEEALGTRESKEVYDLLPEMTSDEWRQVRLVPRGERLRTGGVYFDLRTPDRGELIATGEETVGASELLVSKRDVDFRIWSRLLGRERD